MYSDRKIMFSLYVQPLANLIAAFLIVLAPFLLSLLFLHVTKNKTSHSIGELKIQLFDAIKSKASITPKDHSTSIEPNFAVPQAAPNPNAQSELAAQLRCKNQFQKFVPITDILNKGEGDVEAKGQSLKLPLSVFTPEVCKLLQKVTSSNDLARSEMFIVVTAGLAAFTFMAILFLRLPPGAFLIVLGLVALRGYFANDYVINSYLMANLDAIDLTKIDNIPSLFTSGLLYSAADLDAAVTDLGKHLLSNMYYTGLLCWTTIALLIFTLASLCMRGNGEEWYDSAELRRRRNSIVLVGTIVSLLYSIAIYRINTLMLWGFKLLGFDETTETVALLSHVANGYVQNIAILFSLEIIIVLGIAITVLNLDISKAAIVQGAHSLDDCDDEAWRSRNHLTLNYEKILMPFIVALPAITPLVVDFARQLSGE